MARDRYPLILRALHWLMAAAILAMIATGLFMADIGFSGVSKEEARLRDLLYALHKGSGVLLLGLVLIRIVLRLALGGAPLPDGVGGGVRFLSGAAQVALYGLMLAAPIVGWLAVSAGGFLTLRPVVDGALPALIDKDQALYKQLIAAHFYIGLAILAVVALHVAGAARHLLLRDGVFRRMWF